METKSKHQHLSIGSDMLWSLVILAGFVFFTSLVPLPPNDYWWHLRIGEVIYSEHAIPNTNLYSWTVPAEQPFFYAAWLGELLLYLVHRIGGVELTSFTRTLLAGFTFWLVGNEARRSSGSWRIAAPVLALACLMSINNLIVRPQMWAWLPFVIMYSCLSRYATGEPHIKYLVICPAVMLFWVNLHGSFILGLGMMGIFLFGEVIRFWFKHSGALSKNQLIWLAGATGAALVATLINPRFTGIVTYIKELLANQPVQQLIEEWQSPTPEGWANVAFFISILIIIITMTTSRSRLTPSELMLILAFLWMAWQGQRSVIWYGMVSMPLLAKLFKGVPLRAITIPVQRNALNVLIGISLFIPAVLVQPWFIDKFSLPEAYRAQVLHDPEIGPLLSPHTPTGAARYLVEHPTGKLFNELGFGSYLIWATPELKVFIDPRIELYPQEIWEDYVNISNGVRTPFLLLKYAVEGVILDKDIQPELSLALRSYSGWQCVYEDLSTEIWVLTDKP
jgi:hypothetical protein